MKAGKRKEVVYRISELLVCQESYGPQSIDKLMDMGSLIRLTLTVADIRTRSYWGLHRDALGITQNAWFWGLLPHFPTNLTGA